VARHDSQVDLYVVNADGSGWTQVTDDSGFENSPAWSPDGTRLLVASSVEANTDLYVMSLDDATTSRVTEDRARDYAPSWSPDGRQVLFLSTRVPSSQVFVLDLEDGAPQPLTEAYAHKTDVVWSPDGDRIAFTMLDGYNQGDVYVMNADGGGLRNLTDHVAHDCCAAWAPDGERLVFLSSRNGDAAGVPAPTRRHEEGLEVVYGTGADVFPPLPDVPRPMTTVMPETPKGVYLIGADGGGLVRLTGNGGRAEDPVWSPDGQRIAFVSDRDGNDEIYVMDVGAILGDDGGGLTRLTRSRDDDSDPIWSPDGTCLAFASHGENGSGLYVIQADGSGLTMLADGITRGTGLSWAP
jgi:TolB protein